MIQVAREGEVGQEETMGLSCTVFEILSLIFKKLKRSHESDHASAVRFWIFINRFGFCSIFRINHISSYTLMVSRH